MIGPLQLLVFGFDEEQKARDVVRVAKSLKRAKAIRLFDLVYVIKDQEGTLQAKEISELRTEEKREFGALAKALLGLAVEDVESLDAQELVDSLNVAEEEFGLSDEEIQEVAARVPNGTSAIFVIFEHVWARELHEAVLGAGEVCQRPVGCHELTELLAEVLVDLIPAVWGTAGRLPHKLAQLQQLLMVQWAAAGRVAPVVGLV